MTFKRRVLSALGKDDLLRIGREHELEVVARMSVDELRDMIASSKRATLDKIVTDAMSRDLLKQICETVGVDATGKEKQPLVERIISAANGDSSAREGGASSFTLTNPTASGKKTHARSAPRRSGSGATDDIIAYQHDDKRKNNPPAGLVEFDRPPRQPTKTYLYDPHLDPQLTWSGKAEHTSFGVDTVSLHIHERVNPEAILRAVKREDVQGDLFAKLELPDAKAIDFYQHDIGWANRLVLGDSLTVMNSLLEREQMAGKVQLVFFDPPYGVKFNSNFQPSISRRDVKDGDDGSLTREPEQIQAYRDTWTLGIHSYLTYLRDRLLLARDLLADSGSIFVQISDENVHYVRALMSEVFGEENYCGQIQFLKTTGLTSDLLDSVSDTLIWYARHIKNVKFRRLYKPQNTAEMLQHDYRNVLLADGTTRSLTKDEAAGRVPVPEGAFVYRTQTAISPGVRANTTGPFTFKGKQYHSGANSNWKTTIPGMERLARVGRLELSNSPGRMYRQFLTDFPYQDITNYWDDVRSEQGRIYVVQTASKVVQRCILMCTDPSDLVFDPTCGSGTTATLAEQWGRRWITCDTSRVALALARQRLITSRFPFYRLRSLRVRDGFEYRTVAHVTLKTIAENAALDECKTVAERERLIHSSAQQEVLYDQPYIDDDRVRITGPFTVEAIPVASLDADETPDSAVAPAADQNPANYLGMMIDLLKKSGVQFPNNRHLALASLRPVRGPYEHLHAEAELQNGTTKRVAVSFGPRHAPVTPVQVRDGINETRGYDMVIFVGFACDPEARRIIDAGIVGRELQFANAAPDILVGDLLKTKKTTRLFSTFGAPDVKVEAAEDGLIKLTLAGVDLYDPNTGETTHRSGEDVAAWFIDHDYDGRTFCVCQALFPGGGKNPWEKLQKALKGTIDEDKFETLRTATSLPFKPGKKVAVKVIDDRGNEVIKLVDPKPPRRKEAAA